MSEVFDNDYDDINVEYLRNQLYRIQLVTKRMGLKQSNMKNTKIWNYLWCLDIFNWFIKTLVVYVEMHTSLNRFRIELSIFLISYSVD
jgi:hypothetical protein